MYLPVKHNDYQPEMELLCLIPPAPHSKSCKDLKELFLGRPQTPTTQILISRLRRKGIVIVSRKHHLSIPRDMWLRAKAMCERYWATTRGA